MHRLRREAVLPWVLALAACSRPGLHDFERTLAANDSATIALGQWCERRGLAVEPAIRAIADREAVSAASRAVRQSLAVGPDEGVGYRHVQLACGDKVLSVAHNWYVPALLSPAMNQALSTTDTPFGKVVAPLGFRRERLAQKRGRMAECPSGTVLSHRALLRDREGRPFSLVVECYTGINIGKP